MDQVLTIKKSAEAGLIDLLTYLLKNKKVSGVCSLRKTKKQGKFDYALITDPELLNDVVPLHPLMPVNAGKMLSNMIKMEMPVAAVIKPCELRSFIELVKRSQGKLENFLLISYTCGGALPLSVTVQNKVDTMLPDYRKTIAAGNDFEHIRDICKACEYFIPFNADATVSLLGETGADSTCKIFLHSDKAKEILQEFEVEKTEDEFDRTGYDQIRERRKKYKEELFKQIKIQDTGLDGMIDVFGRCIGCHACSRVCPICYCVLCDFESSTYDYDNTIMEQELSRKGGLRLPSDTILYQIGRLSHMSFSCIGCGQCTEVCPADIPVSVIFRKCGEKVAEIFEYIPGRDVNEQVPVTIFKEEEFEEIGEE